jgi:hypothetical protein
VINVTVRAALAWPSAALFALGGDEDGEPHAAIVSHTQE